jgi:hypothetical protein
LIIPSPSLKKCYKQSVAFCVAGQIRLLFVGWSLKVTKGEVNNGILFYFYVCLKENKIIARNLEGTNNWKMFG